MKVSALEIFCECFGKPKSMWTRKDGDEIAAIMARLPDWERPAGATMRIKDYGKQRVFVRKAGNEAGAPVTNGQKKGNERSAKKVAIS